MADFLISVPKGKVKILQRVQMDPICPNLPIRSKTNANKKRYIYSYTSQWKDYLILIIFYYTQDRIWQLVVWAVLLQLCVAKVTDDVMAKNIFPYSTR